jgi:type IV pilus assembly protein PilE
VKNKQAKGFTLMELMITVAIVGILAAIAIPSYQSYMTRTRRADAMAALQSVSAAMERYKATNNFSYLGATLGAGGVFVAQVPVDGGTAFYTLALSNLTATTFTITATPTGAQPATDGALTMNQIGAKTWGAKTCWPTSGSTC